MTSPAVVPQSPSPMSVGSAGVAIVGASSGIGAALGRAYAAKGYTVALVARRADLLEQLVSEINAHAAPHAVAPVARAYPHDVTAYDEAPALFARIRDDMGPGVLRVLVYNSGVMPEGASGAWTFDEERAMIETNTLGAMRWLALAADAFAQGGGGTVVGISSVAGDRGRRGNSAYMASKAAMSTYLESLRYRYARRGVRVVTVKPGYVATPMTAGKQLPRAITAQPAAVAERIVGVTPSGPQVVYVPGIWAPVMRLVRLLPASMMARLPV